MDAVIINSIYILIIAVMPMTKATDVPGTFFWKQNVGLDSFAGTSRRAEKVSTPTWTNVYHGKAVLIDGFQLALVAAALDSYRQDMHEAFPSLHPGLAHYYTNMYRWALRYLSLIPEWWGGKNKNFVDTHKVWKKRFYHMDDFVPQWMRKLLFFVSDDSWKYEEWEYDRYLKYSRARFSKSPKYSSKVFNNFNSHRVPWTVEDLDRTSMSKFNG